MKRIWVIALVAACTHADPGPSGSGPDATEAVCGDGTCNVGETKDGCPEDCALCGDLVCSPTESHEMCPIDCGACGDGVCDHGEVLASCPADCRVCGDAICSPGEDLASCAGDCSECGDGMCTGAENATSCAMDCFSGVNVMNQSSFTITGVYVYPCGVSDHGQNQISGMVIAPNGAHLISPVPTGCWNFHADASSGVFWDRFNTVLLAGHTFDWTLFN